MTKEMKKENLYLDNKQEKEKELLRYYFDCNMRIRELLKVLKEKEKEADNLNEIVYLLDELRPIYKFALLLPYVPVCKTAKLIGELLEVYGQRDSKEFNDYPFVENDEFNVLTEGAREALQKLLD